MILKEKHGKEKKIMKKLQKDNFMRELEILNSILIPFLRVVGNLKQENLMLQQSLITVYTFMEDVELICIKVYSLKLKLFLN